MVTVGDKQVSCASKVRDTIRNGGLRITTTIDSKMQAAAIAAASPSQPFFQSLKLKQAGDLQDALVAVEAGTGRVKAYYGGDNGLGTDYAGLYRDPVLTKSDELRLGGAHQPGSTMKVYTVAAALMKGYSINSYWDNTITTFKDRKNPVSAGGQHCAGGAKSCQLWEVVRDSLNPPVFAIADIIGQEKIVQLARDAGVRYMVSDVDSNGKIVGNGVGNTIDLGNFDIEKDTRKYFGREVGFGQYPITPLDHAAGLATIAARGYAAQTHFVQKVEHQGSLVYSEKISPKQVKGFSTQMADDLCWAMEKVIDEKYPRFTKLAGGRQSAGKSGTWQLKDNSADNGQAWFVGFTGSDPSKNVRGLATAVWLGPKKDLVPLYFDRGSPIASGRVIGGEGAGPIWKKFMNDALKDQPKVGLPKNAIGVGELDNGNGQSPQPSAPPTDPNNPQPGFPGQPNQPNQAPGRGRN
jgi:membrane peptidoglycan carboxypeptidase